MDSSAKTSRPDITAGPTPNLDGPATYSDMAHLLRRAGFGASPEEIRAAARRGLRAIIDEQLDFDRISDDIDDNAFLRTSLQVVSGGDNLMLADADLKVQPVRLWWIYRILATRRPLQEKMVLFWHNHFTSKDDSGDYMLRQNKLYRRMALGNFRELAQAVSRDPEMVRYLNGDQNFRKHPNENYARELMELFTCGRVGPDGKPNYTEDDIKAAARAFSGWNLRNGRFYFNESEHDPETKTFMGRTADFNGNDIVDRLVALPATASYMCRKLYRYFCAENPSPATMAALTKIYYDSGYEIKPIVRHILTSPEFFSEGSRYGLIKSPVEFIVGALRVTGMADHIAPPVRWNAAEPAPTDPLDNRTIRQTDFNRNASIARSVMDGLGGLAGAMGRMGQELLGPPTVKGWDGGRLWINLNTMVARARYAQQFVQSQGLRVSLPPEFATPGSPIKTVECDAHPYASDPPKLVDSLLWMCGPLTPPPAVRDVLIEQSKSEPDPGHRVRSVLGLIMSSPDYQVC